MAKFPPDRFDGVPDAPLRVGAHRSAARAHRGWIMFAWAALATGILVGAGVVALGVADRGIQFVDPASTTGGSVSPSATPTATPTKKPTATPTATPTPTVTPLLDPSQINSSITTIAILNSTKTAGLAASASRTLTSGGWVVGKVGDASSEAATSIVYYSDSATDNESIALGIAQELGIKSVQQSAAFPGATITVVLGTDFSAAG